jgi:hypothetical protein
MLYGVEPRVLNQAVARNRKRFPADFVFQLSAREYDALTSQIVISDKDDARGAPALRSQIVISKKGRGGRRYLPYAFTEQGVALLSSVLRSARAVEVNIAIMRTFVQLRSRPRKVEQALKKFCCFLRRFFQRLFKKEDALVITTAPPNIAVGSQNTLVKPAGSGREPAPMPVTLDLQQLFPRVSVETLTLVQPFVDAALSCGAVTANKHGEGIQFRPNFVCIERIYTMKRGFKLSLKGDLAAIREHVSSAAPGMWNYTRLRVQDERALAAAIKCLPIAWDAR